MKGVIVAAGLGLRLSPLTENCPKPLLPVQGRPLIDHTIEAFARAGFEELGIVLGHNEAMLACYLRESSNHGIAVCCLHNEQYQRGNGTSIYAARVFVGNEPFVVSMADHLISPQILSALLARPCSHQRSPTTQDKSSSKVLQSDDNRPPPVGQSYIPRT